DHWAACRGGLICLEHTPRGPVLRPMPQGVLQALGETLLVIDTGHARSSAPSNWDLFRRRIAGEPGAVSALADVARAGRRGAEALAVGDWRRLGRAMSADLEARARWSSLVLPSRSAALLAAARRAGAWGGRVCGAGGGGFAVVLAPPQRRRRVADAVAAASGGAAGGLVETRPDPRGLTVRRFSPKGS
ncbi:MAG: hypothetical protein JSV80_17970, partial [Acidobacteriota bacterium]